MKKFWNIIVVLIFVNFMALPSLAAVFGFEIPQTNIIVSEEENHSGSVVTVFEKSVPKTLSVHDFIRFFEYDGRHQLFHLADDDLHLHPYLSIFSPPPEA